MTATATCAVLAATKIHFALPVAVATATVLVAAAIAAAGFLRNATPASGKRFEVLAAVWTLVLYLSLGLAPLALRVL